MANDADRDAVGSLVGRYRAAVSPLRAFLKELHARYAGLRDGKLADYIPELAKADPDWFGICVATVDGQVYDVGDAEQPFTIQSISKPFVYGLALEDHGREYVLAKVGVEPTGDAFNSLIVLDERSNRPAQPDGQRRRDRHREPGARATDQPSALNRLLDMFGRYMRPRRWTSTWPVFISERATGHRNRAIAPPDAQLRHGRRPRRRGARPVLPAVLDAGDLPRPGR